MPNVNIVPIYLKGMLKNFSYILGCEKTKQAVIIDPGVKSLFLKSKMNLILNKINNLGYTVKYIINTHGHSDHVNGNEIIKKATGALIVMHELDSHKTQNVDITLKEETNLTVGEMVLQIIHTPGHSPGAISILCGNNLFTGDTLFVGDSGGTFFPDSNRQVLGESLRRLFTICSDDTIIHPGHHFGQTETSTIYREKRENINAVEYGFYEE